MKKLLREVQLLRQLSEMKENQHTTKVLDVIASEDLVNIFLVMNYVPNDLNKVLKLNVEIDESETI